jgi:5-methylcytosine-specific restriction endonuclease McrA
MPFMTDGKRDYKKELNWEKTQAKHRAKDRVIRVLARRDVEKKTGDLPSSKHVDHIKPLTEGGSGRSKSNLRVISAKANLHKEALRKKR